MRAEYRVLGPLEVLFDGVPLAVPGDRCHVLLATLLLRPNRLDLTRFRRLPDEGEFAAALVDELRNRIADLS